MKKKKNQCWINFYLLWLWLEVESKQEKKKKIEKKIYKLLNTSVEEWSINYSEWCYMEYLQVDFNKQKRNKLNIF